MAQAHYARGVSAKAYSSDTSRLEDQSKTPPLRLYGRVRLWIPTEIGPRSFVVESLCLPPSTTACRGES